MENAPPPDAFQFKLMYLWNGNVKTAYRRRSDNEYDTHSRGSNKIGIPCAVSYLQVLVAVFFLSSLAKDMATTSDSVIVSCNLEWVTLTDI